MENIKLNKINLILIEIGIETYNLWVDNESKKYFFNRVFSYAKANKFNPTMLCSKLGISEKTYYDILNEYNNNLPIEARHKIEIKDGECTVKLKSKTKLNLLYDGLIQITLKNNIISYLSKLSISEYKALVSNFQNYKFLYSQEAIERILNAFYIYEDYLENKTICENKISKCKYERSVKQTETKTEKEEKHDDKDRIKRAQYIVKEFVKKDDNNVMPILIDNDISKIKFRTYVDVVSQTNKELYSKYKEKLQKIIDVMSNVIDKEITENGITRKFDIIDYLNITDMEPKDISSVVGKKSRLLFLKFNKFNEFSFRNEEDFESKVFSEIRIFGAEFDKYNNYIEGTGRLITDEEKQEIINYMNKKNYYKNQYIYNALLKRYVRGTLTFDEKKLIKENK